MCVVLVCGVRACVRTYVSVIWVSVNDFYLVLFLCFICLSNWWVRINLLPFFCLMFFYSIFLSDGFNIKNLSKVKMIGWAAWIFYIAKKNSLDLLSVCGLCGELFSLGVSFVHSSSYCSITLNEYKGCLKYTHTFMLSSHT